MKNLARIRWALFAVVSGGTAAAGLFIGCSGDDVVVHPPQDGSIDGNKADVGTPDTGPGSDAGLDSTTNFDVGPPTRDSYVQQIARLFCMKVANCCTSESTFDYKECEHRFATPNAPGPGLNVQVAPFLASDAGKTQLVEAKARQCFADINRLSCGAISPETFKQIHADCLAGAVGTIPVGQTGCSGSPECAPPNHCDIADGGAPGSGTCAPPRASGAECDLGVYDPDGTKRDRNYYEPHAQCGYLLTGDPGYCANPDTNIGYTNDAGAKCRRPEPNGARCWVNVECASRFCVDIKCDDAGVCDPGYCRNQDTINPAETCNDLRKKDAGPGATAVQPSASAVDKPMIRRRVEDR